MSNSQRALYVVPVIVFNLVFWLVSLTPVASYAMVSYLFIHLAYVGLIWTSLLPKTGVSKVLFSQVLMAIAATHLVVTLVVGLSSIMFGSAMNQLNIFVMWLIPLWARLLFVYLGDTTLTVVWHVIVTGIFVVVWLVNYQVNAKSALAEQQRQVKVDFIKQTSQKLKFICANAKETEQIKAIGKLYDLLYSSPVKSKIHAYEREADIYEKVLLLETAVVEEDGTTILQLCRELTQLIQLRNAR